MKEKKLINNVFKFITDIISWTCISILVVIGICMIWYFVAAKIYESRGEKYEPYFSLYTIISPSMEPNINVYDVILDTRVDDINSIKVGDVITFISTGTLSNGMTVTHRVVEVVKNDQGTFFRTKGDNNQTPDGALVLPENILGKTLLRIPQLGRVQFLLAKRGVWLIVLLIPAVGIIVYDLIKLFETSKIKSKVEKALEKTEIKDDPEKRKKELQRKEELKKKLSVDEDLEEISVSKNDFKDSEIKKDSFEENEIEERKDIEFEEDEIEERNDIDFEDDDLDDERI